MNNWKFIKINEVVEINKVVAVFEIWNHIKLPYGKFKVKILEKCDGSFIGVPNVAFKDHEGNVNWISGFGKSIEEALEDTISCFFDTIKKEEELKDIDFEWASPEDF